METDVTLLPLTARRDVLIRDVSILEGKKESLTSECESKLRELVAIEIAKEEKVKTYDSKIESQKVLIKELDKQIERLQGLTTLLNDSESSIQGSRIAALELVNTFNGTVQELINVSSSVSQAKSEVETISETVAANFSEIVDLCREASELLRTAVPKTISSISTAERQIASRAQKLTEKESSIVSREIKLKKLITKE